MPDIASGLFALGGFALAEAGRWLFAGQARRDALEDREHAERREDDARWVEDRRQAHAQFLTAASALHDDLHAQLLWVEREYGEPPGNLRERAEAVEAALAALELVAGDASSERATEWAEALRATSWSGSLAMIAEPHDEDRWTPWTEDLRGCDLARAAYVAAARQELGTTRRR